MPNLDASTARVVVRMPLSTTPVTDSGEITLTLPTGVYDLNGVSAWLNTASTLDGIIWGRFMAIGP